MNKTQHHSDIPERISSVVTKVLQDSQVDWRHYLNSENYLKVLHDICKRHGSYGDIDDKMCVQYVCTLIQERWYQLRKSKDSSYIGHPQYIENQVFIAVAKFLVSENLVEFAHYYQLLMPSVKNFEIPSSIYVQNVSDIELENLFLSDDEYLLDVSEILDDYEISGKLRIQTITGMRSLSSAEMHRIAAHPSEEIVARFRDVLARYKPRNFGLTKQTVEAVWRLACGVTLSGGGHFWYSQRQNNHSYQAVLNFQEYLDTMPSQERAVLWSYLITRPETMGSLPSTFADVWRRMTVDQECIYGIGKYYHKLAYDFLRDFAYCNIFNSVGEVLELQKQWRIEEPAVLEFVSPAVYVDTPENILALKKINVIEYDIQFRSWDDNGKIPPTVFDVLKLIEKERNQPYPNWEGVLWKTLKLFKEQALKKRSLWGSEDTHNWYRRFLNDDYLNKFIQVDETEHSDSENEPIAYTC